MIAIGLLAAQLTLLLGVTTVLLSMSRKYPRWTSLLGPIVLGFSAAVVVTVISGFDLRMTVRFDSTANVTPAESSTAQSPESGQSTNGAKAPSPIHRADGGGANEPRFSMAGLARLVTKSLQSSRPQGTDFSYGLWFLLGTLAGCQFFRLVLGSRRVRGLCNSCHPSPNLRRTAKSVLGVESDSAPEVWLGDDVQSPFVVWQHPNRIYLPRGFESFSRPDQNAVLAHEYAHLRRRDPGVRLFVDCVMILLGWHPLAWRIRRQIEEAQEMAADFEAATMLGDLHQYRRALSNWLLWMDQQLWKEAPFCVSFTTNSAIRRIQMLKKISGRTVNAKLIVASIALIGSAIVFGGWRLHADDKTKLASAKLSKSSRRDGQLFQREKSAPWETVGDRIGYYHVRRGTFTESPFIQNMLVAGVFPYTKDLSQSMVRELFDNFVSMEGNFVPQAKKLPEEESTEKGHQHEVFASASVFAARFSEAIDWSKYASVVDVQSLFGSPADGELGQELRDSIHNAGTSKSLVLGELKTENATGTGAGVANESQRLRLAALWGLADGGQATIASFNPIPQNFFDDSSDDEPESVEESAKSLAEMTEAVAIGVDCHKDIFTQSIRVAAFPRGVNATALENAVLRLRSAYLSSIKSDDSDDVVTERFRKHQKTLWSGLRTEIVSTDRGDAVVVQFDHTLDLIQTDNRGNSYRATDSAGPGEPLKTLPKAP
ncbi:MAG: M56 family metallopeptidase [Planctomycetota bacterium]